MSKYKWYRTYGFLRAGPPEKIMNVGIVAMHVESRSITIVAECCRFSCDAHGLGVPKEFARATAGVPRDRLRLMAGIAKGQGARAAAALSLITDDLVVSMPGHRLRIDGDTVLRVQDSIFGAPSRDDTP